MSLRLRGINYDTGTEFIRGDVTRKKWSLDEVASDVAVIKNDLHCNTINFYGTDRERLLEAMEIALSKGLIVSVQLRNIDTSKEEMMTSISAFSKELKRFHASSQVILNIGCEASLFTNGFVPGKTFMHRMVNMIWVWPFFPLINKKLSSFLNQIAGMLRTNFDGKLTYGSGSWETIDWTLFDFMGINLYRDKENHLSYGKLIQDLEKGSKPVIITEFGCSSFEGASMLGGGGWTIVDYKKDPPRLKRFVERNETEQANLLCDLIDLYQSHDLYGCYIFDFMEAQQLFSLDPVYDLDRASYGIVKAMRGENGSISWEKKIAFDRVAELYGKLSG